MDVYNKKASIR